eukprot:2611874-Prymnesium_polylepis.1
MTHGKETQRGNRVARARATQPNVRTPLSLTYAPIAPSLPSRPPSSRGRFLRSYACHEAPE